MRTAKSKKLKPALNYNQPWFDVAEASVYLHVSPQTLRRFLHDGSLRAARVGKGFLLDRADLDSFVLRRKRVIPNYRRGTRPWVAQRHAQERKEVAQ